MPLSLINYVLAFVEGFALILSPCILPILPIVLSGSLEGGKRRPLGIVCGFIVTFALFTLFSRELVQHLGINLDLLRQFAFGLIILFGIVMVSDYLSEKFNLLTQRIANVGANFGAGKSDGFRSGLVLGFFISLIWVPCGGPILAAAIIQTAVQKTSLQSFLTFFFFALGSAIPMLVIALLGKKIIDRFTFLKTHTDLLRKLFGVIIIITATLVAFVGPAFFTPSVAYSPMPTAPNVVLPKEMDAKNILLNGLARSYSAPAIETNSVWINSTPLSLPELRGKVVLIDFWTYSCINCVRTLPYLESWYKKYQKDGLVIIGVHTPEFEFEKNPDNVKKAVAQYGITYPVVMDSEYVTWLNYHNQYWPADYLIDKKGNVVYVHFGEGDYAEAEHNIRVLLGLNESQTPGENITPPVSLLQTPETYLGFARADSFYSSQRLTHDEPATYKYSDNLPQDDWALQGKWKVEAEKIISADTNAAIKIHFNAAKVYVVMGSSKPMNVKVLLDGKPLTTILLSNHALYPIVNLKQSTTGIVELVPENPGAEFYTFTFGA